MLAFTGKNWIYQFLAFYSNTHIQHTYTHTYTHVIHTSTHT